MKIQDKNRQYFFWRRYVDFMFKAAYRRVKYCGKEKIPQDGAIIYAPNHTNTLMDALAVLAIDRQAKVFVARADIFKQPTILKFLTFLKMLPINRKRDGKESLAKNEEINEIVIDVLRDKVPFCILPEGTHRAKHSLMPLQKGIFRIAMQANEIFGDKMPVYIVPVGIEFGHYFRFRSSLLVQIGEPINITKFVNDNPELSAPQQINTLRDELTEQMQKVMLQIPDDDNYEATLELAELNISPTTPLGEEQPTLKTGSTCTPTLWAGTKLLNRFTAAQETIKNIQISLKSDPQKTQELLNMAGNFSKKRHALGICISSVLHKNIVLPPVWKMLVILITFPYFIFSAVATSPATLLSMFICSKFQDKAWHNSLKYGLSGVLLPILFLTGVIVAAAVFSWKCAIIFALLFIPSFFFLHEYLRLMRLLISDIKWLIHRDLRKKFEEIKNNRL